MYSESIALKQLSVNNQLQFTVALEFTVTNPSLVTNTINKIDYRAYLPLYSQELFSGTLQGKQLPPKSTVTFTINENIDWTPDIETALDMMKQDKIPVEFSTKTSVDYFGFPIESEKTTTLDIAKYIKPEIQKQVNRFSGMISSLLKK